MARIRLFNPENDIMLQWPAKVTAARAHTLGANVEALRRSGSMLPVWWSERGDAIIVAEEDRGTCRTWLEDMAALFPTLSGIATATEEDTGKEGAPWGWSGDAARHLSAAGAVCPTLAELEGMRMLSHRRTSLKVMEYLKRTTNIPMPALPAEAATETEVERAARGCGGAFYMKAPWSSSGRGVVRFDSMSPRAMERARGIIRHQGSVMLEQALDGVQDFAMLYHIENGRAEWRGYSLFFNTHASYGGNLLCGDDAIEQRLADAGADRGVLHTIREATARALSEIIGTHYTGWLGVDMLLTSDGLVAPCIEVNLRMTMGVVAHYLTERILAPGVEAVYTVEPHREGRENNSPTVVDGRLTAGELMLTPPGAFDFRIRVI